MPLRRGARVAIEWEALRAPKEELVTEVPQGSSVNSWLCKKSRS